MHGPIRDRLEDLLRADRSIAGHQDVAKHLSSCVECSSELQVMKSQSTQLASLRSPEEVEPGAGFYARVQQRIEERGPCSIWSLFVYSPVGKRLAFVSLTVAVMLGGYVIAQESREGHSLVASVVARNSATHYDAPVIGSPAEQRDAVLENFAEHQFTPTPISDHITDGRYTGTEGTLQ